MYWRKLKTHTHIWRCLSLYSKISMNHRYFLHYSIYNWSLIIVNLSWKNKWRLNLSSTNMMLKCFLTNVQSIWSTYWWDAKKNTFEKLSKWFSSLDNDELWRKQIAMGLVQIYPITANLIKSTTLNLVVCLLMWPMIFTIWKTFAKWKRMIN